MFDVPNFIVEALREIAGPQMLINSTALFIDPASGIRIIHSAEEIALYEYGATLASNGMMNALLNVKTGITDEALADYFLTRGMQPNCHPLSLIGPDSTVGIIAPSSRVAKEGDGYICSMGLEGGLTCRKGYICHNADVLPAEQRDYINELAKPYFSAVASWYQKIGIGVTGGELYGMVDDIIPQKKFGWILNPGHLISTEEWLSSPIYKDSSVAIRSGMIVQMDIIPDMPPYCGTNAEDGICIADETLRRQLAQKYPETWIRMQMRRDYMKDVIGIDLKPEILPMSNMAGYYAPFFLNPTCGFKKWFWYKHSFGIIGPKLCLYL